jgi:ribosomal silencing factor RsfS
MPGLREKYELETLWKEGKIVDVHIDVHQPHVSAAL